MMSPNEILLKAKEALEMALSERRQNKELIKSFGPAVIDALKPMLEEIAINSKIPKQEILNAIAKIKIPEINIPEPNIHVNVPDVVIPEIKVPKSEFHFDASKIRIPDVKLPDEMNIKGWVNFMGYDRSLLLNPLPVQLRDAKGNPVNLLENLTRIMQSAGGGGGITNQMSSWSGGKADYLTIKGFMQSAFAELMDKDGNVKIAGTVVSSAPASTAAVPTNNEGVTYNSDNPLPVTITESITLDQTTDSIAVRQVSGFTDSVNVVNANAIDVHQVSGSVDSVYVNNPVDNGDSATALRVVIAGNSSSSVNVLNASLAASLVDSGGVQYSGSNPLPVTIISDAIVLDQTTDSIAVRQVSGFVDSVYVNNSVDNGDSATALRVVVAGNSSSSVNVTNASLAANIVDSGGVAYSGSNPLPVTIISDAIVLDQTTDSIAVRQVSGFVDSVYVNNSVDNGDSATALRVVVAGNSSSSVNVTNASLAASIVDSGGVQYSGSNPLPVTIVSGAGSSTVSVGDTLHDAVDDGGAPEKVGGIAMSANPSKVSGGDRTAFRGDVIGRQLTRPVQVRELMQTAYTSISTGTETTLKASPASTFLDLVYVMMANNSDAAVIVDIRAATGAGIVMSVTVPANGTAGVSLPVPLPQDIAAATWTVDMPDITGTTVYVSALFSQEV